MNVEFSELESLFDLARQTAPNERAALIETVCGNNELLKAQINELLEADSTHDEMLDSRDAVAELLIGQFPRPGASIGPYQLEKVIGSGGMATVFLAKQHTPIQRHVALKVVRESGLCRKAIGRFEAEKQALAAIEHPYVTKIFDAGTSEDGLFYFSMEYIEGQSITKYCDENEAGLIDRLGLFCDVCEGIEHAHKKGIIHRDLKPSNILVTKSSGKLQPKIIDFGIAKALDNFRDEVEFLEATRDGVMIGTPQYMSPEQADMRHERIDSRSDVYSLGAVLHELVTSETPLGSLIKDKGLLKAFELARHSAVASPTAKVVEIEDPSAFENRGTSKEKLIKALRSDLESILLKATHGDPDQRYQTAKEFSDDVQRYCKGQPVLAARFDAVSYFWKWLKRNLAYVGAIALITSAVLIASAFSFYHARQASTASQENESLRATFVENQKELCEATWFRERVERIALAKEAYKEALNQYLKRNSWLSHVPPSEFEMAVSSMHSLLESNLKAHGLGAVIPSEYCLNTVEIPVLQSRPPLEDELGMFPLGHDAVAISFTLAGDDSLNMFESPEQVIFKQNNALCELIYAQEIKLLGRSSDVVADTCDLWAQYLIDNGKLSKAIKLLKEAEATRQDIGRDIYDGPAVFNLLLQAKCCNRQGKRRKANALVKRSMALIANLENGKHQKLLRSYCDEVRSFQRRPFWKTLKSIMREFCELIFRALFLSEIKRSISPN